MRIGFETTGDARDGEAVGPARVAWTGRRARGRGQRLGRPEAPRVMATIELPGAGHTVELTSGNDGGNESAGYLRLPDREQGLRRVVSRCFVAVGPCRLRQRLVGHPVGYAVDRAYWGLWRR
jgi:hypothetical protein